MAIKEVIRYVLECNNCKAHTQDANSKDDLIERESNKYSFQWLLKVFNKNLKVEEDFHLCDKCKILPYDKLDNQVI